MDNAESIFENEIDLKFYERLPINEDGHFVYDGYQDNHLSSCDCNHNTCGICM